MFTGTVAVESRLPAGVAGELVVCSASYVATVYISFPGTAGPFTIQVSAPLTSVHEGLLSVRLVAIEDGVPVKAVPLTVPKAMTIDCVLLETYFGARLVDCVLLGGTVMVKRAVVVAGTLEPAVALDAGSAALELPPPPQPASAAHETTTIARRIMFIVLTGPGCSKL
jgi:hypothetical protein